MDIITCLSLIGYCFAFTRFTKYPIEYGPFFVVSSIITLLYFFAYVHFLKIGTDVILIIGGLLLLLSPIFIDKKSLWDRYFTPGFIISLLLLILFMSLAQHAQLLQWDEFTHWGPHSKFVFYNNGFINASDDTVHRSYPLGGALFQYLFFRLSHFSIGTAYVAQCLLVMASLSIIIHQFEWRSWQKAFIAYTVALLLLSLMGTRVGLSNSLYMDGVVGIYFGMVMVVYFASHKKISSIVYLLPIVIAMTLFKPKILPLILMALFVISIDRIFCTRQKFKKYNTEARALARAQALFSISIASLLIASWLVTLSWHAYLVKIGAPLAWQLNLTLAKIKNTFFAPTGSLSHTVIVNYCHALMPEVGFVAVIFLCVMLTAFLYKNKNDKITLIAANSVLFLGFIAYLFGLLLMYLFTFTSYEAVTLASMSRYLSIYRLGWSLVVLYFLFDAMRYVKYQYAPLVENLLVGIFIIVISALIVIHVIYPNNSVVRTNALRQSIIGITNAVKKVVIPQDKIFTVWQSSKGFEQAIVLYELTPRKFNSGCSSVGKPYGKNDVWTCNISAKQLLKKLSGFNYFLLAYSDNNFWAHYQSIMPNRSTLKPLVRYSVCVGNGFDSFSKSGCHMQTHHAYLFKIVKRQGRVELKNLS